MCYPGCNSLVVLWYQVHNDAESCTWHTAENGQRDVLNVLGMYPGDPGPPGGDCAGVACVGHRACGGADEHRLPLLGHKTMFAHSAQASGILAVVTTIVLL